MSLRIVVASFVTVIAIGCGGGKTPPTTAGGAPAADAGSESFAEVNPADLAELDGGASKAPDA